MLLFVPLSFATPWSTTLADVDPVLRRKIDALIVALTAQGFTPTVSNTWRAPEVQGLLQLGGRATKAGPGESCHNHVDAAGAPASRAVDLWSRPMDLPLVLGASERLAEEAPFLRALGVEAHRLGLRWGGDWHGHPSAWNAWSLGWDPAHVELGRCGGG